MGNIQVLDISVANLIAAGEVVDRPASAIKEMMENSIDAGASEITVEIRNGGSSFMRVTDNGCGMDEADARACIQRHATSKIRNQSDLDSIMTLGFRGEALAAIASVSDFRILTRKHGEEMGTLLRCEAGRVVECCPTGCPEGTTIIAESLFANIPARRKFLKKDVSETAAVIATVEKLALSHPEIAIRLITDGTLRFNTAGDGKLANAIYAVLGRDFAKKLVPVRDMTDGIGVVGYVGRPDNVRGNRNYQNFFINGRYIKSATASAALEQAFVSYCPSDKFPCCVLNLEIHPTLVDVNVHPAKLEVKFSNEKTVFHAVYCAVRNALSQNLPRPDAAPSPIKATGEDLKYLGDLIAYKAESAEAARQMSLEKEKLTVPYRQISVLDPTLNLPAQKTSVTVDTEAEGVPIPIPVVPAEKAEEAAVGTNPFAGNPAFGITPVWEDEEDGSPLTFVASALQISDNADQKSQKDYDPYVEMLRMAITAKETEEKTDLLYAQEECNVSVVSGPDAEKVLPIAEAACDVHEEPETVLPHYTIGGVLFQCYVVVEVDQRVILIDKHAAHERILFEGLKENMKKAKGASQILLIPITLDLSSTERGACEEYRSEINAIGFAFEEDGESGRMQLTQIPDSFSRIAAAEAFQTLVGELAEGKATVDSARDTLYEKALFQASCKAAVKAGREDDPGHICWIVEQTLSNPQIRFCPHGRPVSLEMTKSQVEHLFHRP